MSDLYQKRLDAETKKINEAIRYSTQGQIDGYTATTYLLEEIDRARRFLLAIRDALDAEKYPNIDRGYTRSISLLRDYFDDDQQGG